MGELTTVERVKVLQKVKELSNEGLTSQQIADKIGVARRTVTNHLRYLKELSTSDLTMDELGRKREELYLELLEATEEARNLFYATKETGGSLDIKRHFESWMQAITARAKLFGLDNMKVDSLIQVNQTFNAINHDVSDKIDFATGERMTKMIISNHENRAG